MDVPQSSPVAHYNPLRWIPEFLELGRRRLRSQAPLQLDDRLDRAQKLFVEHDLLALPVVDNLAERRVVGMVGAPTSPAPICGLCMA